MSKEAEEFAALVFSAAGMVLLSAAMLAALSLASMLAWNWSMPHLFGLPEATYRNAAGAVTLAWCLKRT